MELKHGDYSAKTSIGTCLCPMILVIESPEVRFGWSMEHSYAASLNLLLLKLLKGLLWSAVALFVSICLLGSLGFRISIC